MKLKFIDKHTNNEASNGINPSEEAEEDGGAEHEEPDDVDEQERLAGDGRGPGPDLAVPAVRHRGAAHAASGQPYQ